MEKKKISAKIVADSIDHRGNRITTYVLTYPRFIHSELMTHRLFSRNAASSRAIPFNKMVQMIEEDPFIPIAWQKDHKGMQGSEYFTDQYDKSIRNASWLRAKDTAILETKHMHLNGVTKQLCNRLLEPYQWYTVLVTATEFDNFFELRCPKYKYLDRGTDKIIIFYSRKDWLKYNNYKMSQTEGGIKPPKTEEEWWQLSESGAEIHIQALAEVMWDARNESEPEYLTDGNEWHFPFSSMFDKEKLKELEEKLGTKDRTKLAVKIATARCARLSYMTFDGEIDYEKDIALHDQLFESKHASPFEHCCRVLNEEEYNSLGKMILHPEKGYVFEKGWVDNIRGFISYRRILNI